MWIPGQLIIAILCLLNLTVQKRCGRLFPMTLGGKNSANFGNQLDYHEPTGQLAMSADTRDSLFAGSSTTFSIERGLVALLKEPLMDIIWIKTVSLISYMQAVTFSADGMLVMTHTSGSTANFMFIFSALDGTLVKSISYQTPYSYYPLNQRNILIGSPVGGTYQGFVHTNRLTSSMTNNGFQTFAFSFSSAITPSILWQRMTQYVYENPYAIVFSHTESFLYAFSQMKTTNYLIARLDAANGNIVWQYYFIPTISYSETLVSSTLARKTLADGVNEVIIAHRGSGSQRPIFVRIVADFTTGTMSTTTPPTTYIDSASTLASGMRAFGQFIIDQDETVFLIVKAYQTYFGLLNFASLTASYKRALPILKEDFLGMSVMKSDTKFYAITSGYGVQLSSSTSKSFFTEQPIILSSEEDESCQTVYTEAYASNALSKSVAITALNAYNYFSDTVYTGVTLTLSTSITTFSYDIAHMNNVSSWCPLYTTTYGIQNVTQNQTTFYYTAGTSDNFPITPYSSVYQCGSITPVPVFEYSGYFDSNGVALVPADFISVSPTDGQIAVSIAGTALKTAIKIEGVLTDLAIKWSQVFTLTEISYIRPELVTPPQNLTISVFNSSTMDIGTIIPYPGRTPSVMIQLLGGGTPPSFITFASPNVTFNTPNYTEVAVHKLEIKVWDSFNTLVYPFNLTVKNEPPVFIEPAPVRFEAISGVNTSFTFPAFQDPELQECNVSIVSGPPFISISGVQLIILSSNITDIKEHNVTIKLEDGQPMSKNYTFKVVIINRAPELTGALQNKTVPFKGNLNYTLPVMDPEGMPLVLRVDALQEVKDFTTVSSISMEFAPILRGHIGTFKIDVNISDSSGQTVGGNFWLSVIYKEPYFVSAKSQNQDISVNQETIYNFPYYVSFIPNTEIVLTSLPSFAQFSQQILTFNPKQQDLGQYPLEGYLTDGIQQIPFSFIIKVINKAPAFATKLNNLQVLVLDQVLYPLPEIIDEDVKLVLISPSFEGTTKLPLFITFDLKQKAFIIHPQTNEDAGTYLIQVVLTDSSKASSISNFFVTVIDLADLVSESQVAFSGNELIYKASKTGVKNKIKQNNQTKWMNKKPEINGNIKIKEITRDGRVIFRLRPYRSINITEQITNETIIMVLEREGKDKERVQFNITRRESETGEIEAMLEFTDNIKVSEGTPLDMLEVIIKEDIECESHLYYVNYQIGKYSSRFIPSQIKSNGKVCCLIIQLKKESFNHQLEADSQSSRTFSETFSCTSF